MKKKKHNSQRGKFQYRHCWSCALNSRIERPCGVQSAHLWSDGCCESLCQSKSDRPASGAVNRFHLASSIRRAKWMPPWPSSNHLIVLCSDMSRKDPCRGAPLMCHLFAITWQLPWEEGERGGGGGSGGSHNLVSFTPIYMDTLGQWKSFPFEDRKRGEKARRPELNCENETRCVKVCANISSADCTRTLRVDIWNFNGNGILSFISIS